MDAKNLKTLERLEEQIRDIREERIELYQELMLHKEKMRNKSGMGSSAVIAEQSFDLKGAELEEECTHLNAENRELH